MRSTSLPALPASVKYALGALVVAHAIPSEAQIVTVTSDSDFFTYNYSYNGTDSYGYPYGGSGVDESSTGANNSLLYATGVAFGALIGPSSNTPYTSGVDLDSQSYSYYHYTYPCGKNNTCAGVSYQTSAYNPNLADPVYLPFSFSSGLHTDYGYVELSIYQFSNYYTANVLGFTYNASGGSITAGQMATVSAVPETGTLPMLALGLAGLAFHRRKQVRDAISALRFPRPV